MWTTKKIEIVHNRLNFINQLSEVKEHFRGHEKMTLNAEEKWTHPYEHFSALRVYLALTCFDILGQSNDWKDFGSWLKSKRKSSERTEIIEKHADKEIEKTIISVHDNYTKIYGVKKSFLKFIREIISEQNKEKLFDSIAGAKRLTYNTKNSDGTTTVGTSRSYELSQNQKENFLFKIRNSFTHNGIPIGDISGAIFEVDEPRDFKDGTGPIWLYSSIYEQKIGNDSIIFKIKRWPFVLLEIINETIENKGKK